MKMIPFFDPAIRISVSEASSLRHVGMVISIEQFAAGEPVALYENEDCSLIVYRGVKRPGQETRPFIAGFEYFVPKETSDE